MENKGNSEIRWLNEYSKVYLENGYLVNGQTVEDRLKFIAKKAEKILKKKGFADKFYDYMCKGFYSLSSPIWSNFGLDRGLPISCFGSYIGDTMSDILYTEAEVGMMSKFGGGASGYFGALRPRGSVITNNGYSSGAVHFMQLFETLVDVVSQGSVRRGHFSPYLPVEHPDIKEFLKIGTEGNPIQKLTHGVTVTDKWLEEMVAGDVEKRAIWAEVIQRRGEMGYPYIFFTDNVNNNTVDVYKDKKMKIYASNMCSEIMLPSSEEESFVCNLSSMNIFYYDEWKDTDAVETLTYFLDAVMEDFIEKLEKLKNSDNREDRNSYKFMKRAYKFAKAHRAIGIGVIGWHSYLQSKMIAFEDAEAYELNKEIFKLIHKRAYKASEEMAKEYGEPELLKGYGRGNSTLLSVAPTTSSAFILGQVSQSIEPWWSNCYVKDLAKIKTTIKNKELEKILELKGKNTREVWNSIRDRDGSVQHLDFLTDREKNIFKTFSEINQYAIIDQAADRQKFIDQGQSLNLMIHPKTSAKDINALYIDAWKQGIKSLYYQHSKSAAQELSRKIVCAGCEG
ncbi:ribonucleoside-diphosphate reductase subunit alpha [Candidatus Gracilibacteria bacterium]|nr:ribonucleoside-diphosphate reductase subunit alpha [Candidatus Gracilibacteria bacterium]